MLNFWRRELKDVLNERKTISIYGIRFRLKKIDVLTFLQGYDVMQSSYAVYKPEGNQPPIVNHKKIREYYAGVILAGVENPKITVDGKDGTVKVDDLFNDWAMVQRLHDEIAEYSYGKKKA